MRFALVLLAACSTTASGPSYPLHPRVRSASGGPVVMLGAVAHPGNVPYSPGMTLTLALRLAGGPTGFANHMRLERDRMVFTVPLRDVIDHEAPDPELAPGDVITVSAMSD